jgi:magnesium chelatase subunit I
MHYGLLPRANRGIFAINELPDLASKVQVGLFNILQEGDVQIKGYPVRLALDVLLVFSANPEDYTARGKIITPLKDRIGSEIRTHYPKSRHEALAITRQEAWTDRPSAGTPLPVEVPAFVREVVEEIAFQARADQRVDRRSGVSQRLPITCLENAVSNAERRALVGGETVAVPRVTDVYAALPSLTGKIELEYEGELKGAETIARDLVRAAVATVFDGYSAQSDVKTVVRWFDNGGHVELSDISSARQLLDAVKRVEGLSDLVTSLGAGMSDSGPHRAAIVDFVLEGLCALKKISRSEEGRVQGVPGDRKPRERDRPLDPLMEDDDAQSRRRKKYN